MNAPRGFKTRVRSIASVKCLASNPCCQAYISSNAVLTRAKIQLIELWTLEQTRTATQDSSTELGFSSFFLQAT